MKQTVYILKERTLRPQQFKEILGEIGLLDRLKNATIIGIKPNLAAGTRYYGDSAILVSREHLEAVIQGIRTVNSTAEIHIMEGDSTGHGYTYLKYEKQGYREFQTKYPPLKLVDLSRDRLCTMEVDGDYFDTVELAESIFKTDFFISIAKMKTHNMTLVTGATKNLFGCLPESDKSVFHGKINQVIGDHNDLMGILGIGQGKSQ